MSGTSGIGKSFFGIYALFRAVREKNITVIYNYSNEAWYVIAPPEEQMQLFDKGDPRRRLLDLRYKYPDCSIGEDLLQSEKEEDGQKKDGQSLWWGKIHIPIFLGQNTSWHCLPLEHQHGCLLIC